MEHRLAAFEPGEARAVVVEQEARGAVDLYLRAVGERDGAMFAGGGLDRVRAAEQAEARQADRANERRGDGAAKPGTARGAAADGLAIPGDSRLLGRGQGIQIGVEAGDRLIGVALSGVCGEPVGETVPAGETRNALEIGRAHV